MAPPLLGMVPALSVPVPLLGLAPPLLVGLASPPLVGVAPPLAPLVTGRSYFRPVGVEHDVINANSFEFVFIEVEFKTPGP